VIELEMIGGAGTVTGSKHLLRTSRATVLLECGLFQGHRREGFARNRNLGFDVTTLDAVVLSHAHLDHSGAAPMLSRHDYRGPIYATPATRDLCVPLLEDSAQIQASDAAHIARLIERGVDLEPVTPLYDSDDVTATIALIEGLPYHRRQTIAPGIELTFLDAGHVLGSAIVVLDIDDGDHRARLAFTGDLGHARLPILRDPEIPTGVTCLITEATYGNRRHGPIRETLRELAAAVTRTVARGGKVVIPTFALERAQEVVFALKQLRRSGAIPAVPVYVDSPLAVKITDVFRLHPDCISRETFAALHGDDSPFDFDGLRYVSDVEESKRIDADPGPAIILAGSGMCEGGRVLHHLRATIEDLRSTVILVGYQAEHTLGRRLLELRREVRIFGVMRSRNADVVNLEGLSAHADQAELVAFAEAVRDRGALRQVILVHGEPPALSALAEKLADFPKVTIPAAHDRIEV
jgi:metallo-beta-lactamase family protein